MDTKKWQPLESCLKKGFSLEKAAEHCGVPIEEAKQWVRGKEKLAEFDDTAYRFCAGEGFELAIEELKTILMTCPDDNIRQRAAAVLITVWRDERNRLERKMQKSDKGAGSETLQTKGPWLFPEMD